MILSLLQTPDSPYECGADVPPAATSAHPPSIAPPLPRACRAADEDESALHAVAGCRKVPSCPRADAAGRAASRSPSAHGMRQSSRLSHSIIALQRQHSGRTQKTDPNTTLRLSDTPMSSCWFCFVRFQNILPLSWTRRYGCRPNAAS